MTMTIAMTSLALGFSVFIYVLWVNREPRPAPAPSLLHRRR